MDEALRALLDKQAITEVLYRYCRALDRMDREEALTVWHPDAIIENSPVFKGTREEYLDRIWPMYGGTTLGWHDIGIVNIHLDGDRATSETYYTWVARQEPEPGRVHDLVSRGRYLDRWSRRDGEWAMDHRRYVEELRTEIPVSETMAAVPTTSARGDRSDPSYDVLGWAV